MQDAREKNSILSSKYAKESDKATVALLLNSVLANLVNEFPGRVISNPSPTVSYEFAIIANLLKALVVAEDLILEGMYVSGSAVLRQSLEMNARLAQLREGRLAEGVPNVGILGPVASIYGELSEVAHISKQRTGSTTEFDIGGGVPGQYIAPVFNPSFFDWAYDRYLMCSLLTCRAFMLFVERSYSANTRRYRDVLSRAAFLLEKVGVIKFPEPDASIEKA